MNFNDNLEVYKKRLMEKYAINTFKNYYDVIYRIFNNKNINDYDLIIKNAIEDYKKKNVKNNTINNFLEKLKSWEKFLKNTTDIKITKDIKYLHSVKKEPSKVIKFLTDKETQAIFNFINTQKETLKHNNLLAVYILLKTGVRISEFKTYFNNIELWKDKEKIAVKGKGRTERYININEQMRELAINIKTPFLWPESTRGIAKRIAKLGLGIGKKDLTPHMFRKTYGTNWIENGFTIEGLRINMGHQSLDTTQKYIANNPKRNLAEQKKFQNGLNCYDIESWKNRCKFLELNLEEAYKKISDLENKNEGLKIINNNNNNNLFNLDKKEGQQWRKI